MCAIIDRMASSSLEIGRAGLDQDPALNHRSVEDHYIVFDHALIDDSAGMDDGVPSDHHPIAYNCWVSFVSDIAPSRIRQGESHVQFARSDRRHE
jgi:hypothetical protein